MSGDIQETRRKRFQYLHKLYEVTEGSELEIVNMFELGKDLGFSDKETNLIVDYLKGEYLLKFETLGGGIVITHFGVVEVENALAKPDEPSQYFPPVNIIAVGQMVGSQIQQ